MKTMKNSKVNQFDVGASFARAEAKKEIQHLEEIIENLKLALHILKKNVCEDCREKLLKGSELQDV